MKSTAKKLDKSKAEFKVEVSADEVARKFDEVYAAMAKTVEVSGFRRGKVPRELLERHYGEAARNEVLKVLVPDSYRQAADRSEFVAVGYPHFSEIKLESGMLSFTATVDVKPTLILKKYKGLRAKRKPVDIKEEEVSKVLSYLQEKHAHYVTVAPRAVKTGDYIICDIQYFVDGKSVEKKEKVLACVGQEFGIPKFWDSIVGASPGDTKEVKTVLPEDFFKKDLAGKEATFNVTISEIKEKKLPQLDDEFAKDLQSSSLEELRQSIRRDLEAKSRRQTQIDVENQLLEQVLKSVSFDAPDSLVSAQLKRLVDDAKADLASQGVAEAEISKHEQILNEKLRPNAEKQVKIYFILEEIAELESIKVSQEEVDSRFAEIAMQWQKPVQEVRDYFKREEILENLIIALKEEKTLKFLVDNARIEEVRR